MRRPALRDPVREEARGRWGGLRARRSDADRAESGGGAETVHHETVEQRGDRVERLLGAELRGETGCAVPGARAVGAATVETHATRRLSEVDCRDERSGFWAH